MITAAIVVVAAAIVVVDRVRLARRERRRHEVLSRLWAGLRDDARRPAA